MPSHWCVSCIDVEIWPSDGHEHACKGVYGVELRVTLMTLETWQGLLEPTTMHASATYCLPIESSGLFEILRRLGSRCPCSEVCTTVRKSVVRSEMAMVQVMTKV